MIQDLPQHIEQLQTALTAEQLSKFLNISSKTVYEWANKDRIPSYRFGTAVRFDPKTIADWLRDKKQ